MLQMKCDVEEVGKQSQCLPVQRRGKGLRTESASVGFKEANAEEEKKQERLLKNPVLLYRRLNVKREACLPRYTPCEVQG